MTDATLCKVCGAESTFLFHSGWEGQPETFPYYRCSNRNCGLLHTDYLDNRSNAEISEIYNRYWEQNTGEERAHLPLDKVKLAQVIVPQAKTVLDIGSGEGWGVKTLMEAGFDAYGYDVAEPKMCHERITVGARSHVSGQYDVVTAIEVMEHLTDPIEACQWIASLVRPGGVFAFSTSTFKPSELNENWWYLKKVGHVSLHTRSSLGLLAEATGFKVVADIFGTHLWLRGNRVPLGSAPRIKLKHFLHKALDERSYRILRARLRNYDIGK
jgi:SAM-dependent methyltransferase